MDNKLDRIETMLRQALGGRLLARCPALKYDVHKLLLCFLRTDATLYQLLCQIDSAVFMAVNAGTDRTMVVTLDDGRRARITQSFVRDLADRLLAVAYDRLPVSPTLQDALFDFSREGSFAAMRELVRRFPMDEFERACYETVLSENNQTA